MTACVNKKHSRRVAAAVSASLVGALTLGAAPAVVLAQPEAGVEQQFVSADGAFANAEVVNISFSQGGDTVSTPGTDTDGDYQFVYERNHAVALRAVRLKVTSSVQSHPDFTVDATEEDSQFDIAYYERGEDGKPAEGAQPITDDIINVGEYVAVITAKEGSTYGQGSVYITFDITPRPLTGIEVKGERDSVYDAEAKSLTFWMDVDGKAGKEQLYDPTDIEVTWIKTGGDTSEKYQYDEVVDQGTYRALVKAAPGSNYAGTVELDTQLVNVDPLNLGGTSPVQPDHYVYIPDIFKTGDQPGTADLDGIYIDGQYHGKGSAIMKKLKMTLTPDTDVWYKNDHYKFEVAEATKDDPNIDGQYTMNAYKVGELAKWQYKGKALSDHQEIVVSAAEGNFNDNLITATDAEGKPQTVVKEAVYDANGVDVNYPKTVGSTGKYWWEVPGDYVAIYRVNTTANYELGGQVIVNVKVWADAVNADASATVSYGGKVVTSISETYNGSDLAKQITLDVKDSKGNPLTRDTDYTVSFYNADGDQVREVKNAGTYTMKVTSNTYKLSGTTEMTITISPLKIGAIDSDKLISTQFGVAGAEYEYLPWTKAGYAVKGEGDVQGLGLFYLDEDEKEVWLVTDRLVNDVVKVVITNSEGEVVDKITDEGAYTLSFVARNDDAKNNYVMPADLVIECIKDGKVADKDGNKVNHVKFVDVRYTDYFANAVAKVSDKGWMNGYKNTSVFGALDNLSRGQVATVLYNMAGGASLKVEGSYSDLWGYETGFSDVDGKAYYARAIAWAKQSGVVNGYADGTFHPDQAVTRQEFACMLANYAKKFDKSYEAPSADAMDEMSDAAQVADFAKTSVAWAVENGIIGNSGYVAPGANIIRADAACMVYNYAE